mmetsp:Transcript_21164/g.58787  ORF Transcript_21164/g.58787 Transcript_21164/m.58787 type:complete len:150 (+) Transcript_21164:899-1348(+)|eukprot:1160141-Pelagomonas_calceolata.AAC.14
MQDSLGPYLEQIRSFVAKYVQHAGQAPQVILVGGTATTAVALLKGMASIYDGEAVHGSVITVDDFLRLASQFERDQRSREAKGEGWSPVLSAKWLTEKRWRSLPAGCMALAEVVTCCGGIGTATVSNRDLLDAVLMQQHEKFKKDYAGC